MDVEQAPPPLSGDYKHQGPTSRVRMPAHPIGAAVMSVTHMGTVRCEWDDR